MQCTLCHIINAFHIIGLSPSFSWSRCFLCQTKVILKSGWIECGYSMPCRCWHKNEYTTKVCSLLQFTIIEGIFCHVPVLVEQFSHIPSVHWYIFKVRSNLIIKAYSEIQWHNLITIKVFKFRIVVGQCHIDTFIDSLWFQINNIKKDQLCKVHWRFFT